MPLKFSEAPCSRAELKGALLVCQEADSLHTPAGVSLNQNDDMQHDSQKSSHDCCLIVHQTVQDTE